MLLWIGVGALGVGLLAVPMLAIFFLGHRTDSPSPATKQYLRSTDVGSAHRPHLGADGVPVSLHAKAPGNGQVIDQRSAHEIIEDTWAFRLVAIRMHDSDLLAKFETGVQLDADRNPCGCDPPPGTAVHSWSASAPRQTTYPQHFLGQVIVHIGGADEFELMAFRRDAPTEPWKLEALTGTVSSPTFGPPLALSHESANLATDPNGLSVNSASAAAEAAEMHAYWQFWVDHGTENPNSYLSAGYGALTDRGKVTAAEIQAAHAAGVDLSYHYTDDSGPHGPAIFPGTTMPGSAVVCGGTSYTSTYTATGPSGTFHQTAGDDALIDPSLLAEGNYRQVEIRGYRPWCLVTSSDHRVWSSIGFTGKAVAKVTH
ncbi:MAG TPA: hypothetical protein VFN21_06160 [Acidimicrobiales bacterium]|nr:hypothetical protein [Acidimicrobiales bacterium]